MLGKLKHQTLSFADSIQKFIPLLCFMVLLSCPKFVEARIGCSYDQIKSIEDLVSLKTADKYVEWVCGGLKPEPPEGFKRRQVAHESQSFFDGTGKDSVHLEYEPLGILSSNNRVLNVFFQHLMENRIAFGGGLYQLDGSPAFGDLFLIGGYHFEFEGSGEFLPQLRYGPNLGLQAAIPYSMSFGSYFAGAGFKINGLPPWKRNDFVIGIHGGYKF